MLPPLRDRGDDVALLAREFLQRYAAQNNKKSLAFSPDALRALYRTIGRATCVNCKTG
jgi:Transcriptional regulator containing GAF, AAA-type ATPase, and DNA binding domains